MFDYGGAVEATHYDLWIFKLIVSEFFVIIGPICFGDNAT